jgi:hypothetical protein
MAQISLAHNIKGKKCYFDYLALRKKKMPQVVLQKIELLVYLWGFEWIKVTFCRSENFIVMDWTNLHVPF